MLSSLGHCGLSQWGRSNRPRIRPGTVKKSECAMGVVIVSSPTGLCQDGDVLHYRIGSVHAVIWQASTNWAGPVRYQIYYGPECGDDSCQVPRDWLNNFSTQLLVTVKFPPYLLDVKLEGVEVCDLLLIQPLLDDCPDIFYWHIVTSVTSLCVEKGLLIPRTLALESGSKIKVPFSVTLLL